MDDPSCRVVLIGVSIVTMMTMAKTEAKTDPVIAKTERNNQFSHCLFRAFVKPF